MNPVTATTFYMVVHRWNHNLPVMDVGHISRHAFSCVKGGFIIIRHNELRDEFCDVMSRAFQPLVVCYEADIHKCRPAQAEQPCTPMAENEDFGDVLYEDHGKGELTVYWNHFTL
jgi:hypothetical protein